MKWSLCFAASAALLCPNAQAAVDERSILLELYESTGGKLWNENYGWAENLDDICDWYGVVCESEIESNGRKLQDGNDDVDDDDDTTSVVVGLRLQHNFLIGRTTSSLWQLPKLRELVLAFNPHLDVTFVGLSYGTKLAFLNLHDTATSSLTGLSGASESLTALHLSQSKLDTQIPADLYELTHLSSLHMSECGLQGTVPNDIHRLSTLRELNLYDNDLTGTIPSGLSRLVQMRHLTLSSNHFHGTIPDYFEDFVMLENLWLDENDLEGPIPSFAKAPNLEKLVLMGNALTGNLPFDFLEATRTGPGNPIYINLSHNVLTGEVPEHLERLASLTMTWELGDNEWTAVNDLLCDNVNWNEGAIANSQCRGLLCPIGTFQRSGYETADAPCQPCESAEYFGATSCFDKDDHSVLVEFYVELQGEKWRRNDNWLDTDNVCEWYGVECWDLGDSKTGRVRKVRLPNNNMVGTVPETIYSMHHLTTIDVSRNDIVLSFANLHEAVHMYSINVASTQTSDLDGVEGAQEFLHELYFDQLPLQGTIPAPLFEVSTLKILSLQECGLTGEINSKISNLVNLEELYLSDNNLKGNLPDTWDQMEKLQIVALAKNMFTGDLPNSFGTAPSLQAVSLQDQVTKGGGISGEINPYATSQSLRTLLLGDNKLEGEVPEDLLASVDISDPVTVDLSNNLLTGRVPGALNRFERMNLYLEGNKITAMDEHLCTQPEWMGGTVGVFGCDAILCPIGTMGGRRQYNDQECVSCATPETTNPDEDTDSGYLGQATCGTREVALNERDILEILYERCNGSEWHSNQGWLSDESICEWYGIDCDETGSVVSINLGGNELIGILPTEIFSLPNLAHLKLFSNLLFFNFDGIDQAKSLTSLLIDNTGLESLKGIGAARNLKELNVAFNRLYGPMPEEISRLINLETFTISNNAVAGPIPNWIRNLPSLTSFSAANNKFEGPLYDFADFGDLIYIDLSNNLLTGPIPKTFLSGAADVLAENYKIVADLSNNRLEGNIPSELGQLSRLSLILKGNKISGIDSELCEIEGWNDYDVEQFGCDAILCPVGTFNHAGRQTSEESPCEACHSVKYMGATVCSSASRMLLSWTFTVAVSVWYLIA